MKKATRVLCIILAALVVLSAVCGIYLSTYSHADETARTALLGSETVTVSALDGDTVAFIPDEIKAGLIFYPGGKVEYTAYAPLMLELAEQGILCILPKMPCNLAVLDMNRADGLMELFPDVTTWWIGGHSLGGAMASAYAASHPGLFKGILLLAAYSTYDLHGIVPKAVSIYGTEDGVMNRASYEKYHDNLPSVTEEIVIEGGNHAQFGNYGPQKGDGEARIPADEQRFITCKSASDAMLN